MFSSSLKFQIILYTSHIMNMRARGSMWRAIMEEGMYLCVCVQRDEDKIRGLMIVYDVKIKIKKKGKIKLRGGIIIIIIFFVFYFKYVYECEREKETRASHITMMRWELDKEESIEFTDDVYAYVFECVIIRVFSSQFLCKCVYVENIFKYTYMFSNQKDGI